MAKISGYRKPLYVLPFDHRLSFMEKMFGIVKRKPTPDETKKIIGFKKIIYSGFKKALTEIPKEKAAILVDEQFGADILVDAKKNGYLTCLAVEKSGQQYLSLEYGKNFGESIKKYQPTFVKVLIRYNPEDRSLKNKNQLKTLKELYLFCQNNNYKLMIEALVPPTSQQLKKVKNNTLIFEENIRPKLTINMLQVMQKAGIKPAVWKLEGFNHVNDYKLAVKQARVKNKNVGLIILGRGENKNQIERWLKTGSQVKGVTGFAIGRTVFWRPLVEFKNNEIDSNLAAEKISQNYIYFYKIFTKNNH